MPQKAILDENITVGMSAHGNYSVTQQALQSLFNSATGDFELILVDDCSPDDTRSLFLEAKNVHAKTRVLAFDDNKEYSGSLDAILSHAAGDLVLFLSNDIYVTPSYLREIIRAARYSPDHGIVRGCSNFVDNGLSTHNIPIPPELTGWNDLAEFSEQIANKHGGEYLLDKYLTGDAFLVTRAVIDKIGTFDPLFYGYFADHDYGVRARTAGFELVLARGAYAMHNRSANFSYLPKHLREKKLGMRWSRIYENWARFKMKYGLPVELPYTGINDIDWDSLSCREYRQELCYSPPRDYSRYSID
ncbi:MAG TPA: glycosyltransferase family 2 protein [Thiolapillus brandeum]|uniref:Glycosyltransferase family 2 protein n=1 Tax=Thiolapillus brandeum TaxID=1076588 RepID=A0A831RR17_9GAMM|nr:glycosyltransferase family 2 protein [Thiolapillus brandeum]